MTFVWTIAIIVGVLIVQSFLGWLINAPTEHMVTWFLLAIWAQREAKDILKNWTHHL